MTDRKYRDKIGELIAWSLIVIVAACMALWQWVWHGHIDRGGLDD